jgi:hypothetical protein
VLLCTQDGGMSATIAGQVNRDELGVSYTGRVSVRSDILIDSVLIGAHPSPGSRLTRETQLLADGTLRRTASAQDGTDRTRLTWKPSLPTGVEAPAPRRSVTRGRGWRLPRT